MLERTNTGASTCAGDETKGGDLCGWEWSSRPASVCMLKWRGRGKPLQSVMLYCRVGCEDVVCLGKTEQKIFFFFFSCMHSLFCVGALCILINPGPCLCTCYVHTTVACAWVQLREENIFTVWVFLIWSWSFCNCSFVYFKSFFKEWWWGMIHALLSTSAEEEVRQNYSSIYSVILSG